MEGRADEFTANELWSDIRGPQPTPGKGPARGEELVTGLPAGQPERGQLVVLTGILGDDVQVPGRDGMWTLLSTDLEMNDWVIIEPGGAVRHRRVENLTMSGIHYDIIWVRATAFIGRGTGPPEVNAQFLTGDFMRAADFDPELTGGTVNPPSGDFCRPPRGSGVRCCTRKSN